MENLKLISAVLFQFVILGVLSYALFKGIGDQATITGALIGLAVGIGLNTIRE